VLALLDGQGRYIVMPEIGELRIRRDYPMTMAVEDDWIYAGLRDEQLWIELEEVTE
jgi:hypothetical protein